MLLSSAATQKMGCSHLLLFPHSFAIPFLILVISTSSPLIRSFHVEGRKLAQTPDNSQTTTVKAMWRNQIGSRPPRCEQRCGSCARCQAIQVPTNARINHSAAAAAAATTAWRSDQGTSNYKPMSWKCKCGNLIFNP